MTNALRRVEVADHHKDGLEEYLKENALGYFVEFRWMPRYDDWLLDIVSGAPDIERSNDTANHFYAVANAWLAGFDHGRKDGAK